MSTLNQISLSLSIHVCRNVLFIILSLSLPPSFFLFLALPLPLALPPSLPPTRPSLPPSLPPSLSLTQPTKTTQINCDRQLWFVNICAAQIKSSVFPIFLSQSSLFFALQLAFSLPSSLPLSPSAHPPLPLSLPPSLFFSSSSFFRRLSSVCLFACLYITL